MNFKSMKENGYEAVIGDGRHLTNYMKKLIKENRISEGKAMSIKDNLKNSYDKGEIASEELIIKVHEWCGDLEYTKIFKNILTYNEMCPICLKKMEYEKSVCTNCSFDLEEKYSKEDIRNMMKIRKFVESHGTLKKEVEEMKKDDIHEDNFIHDMYTTIYFDENLKEDYDNLKLNEVCDLDEYFAWMHEPEDYENDEIDNYENNINIDFNEIDFCKLADNKYRLKEREDDSLIIPVDLNKYKYFKLIEETNDDELALYDLAFVPWCLRQHLRELSFEEGYITHNATKENWHDFSKDESNQNLKEFLKKNGIKPLKTKKEVIKQIYDSNQPLEEFKSEKTYLTKKAYDYLKEYTWIGFYIKHLFYFDFLDFFDYFESYDGNTEEISLKYLDEHIELAIKSLDFNYIIRTYNAKSEINHMTDNLENALKCDMRILILNMNPICLDYNLYPMHIPLDVNNVANLKKLKSKFGEEHILNAFNENWNFMRFKSTIIPKDDVWKYLTTALNSSDENHGSRKIREKYFNKT